MTDEHHLSLCPGLASFPCKLGIDSLYSRGCVGPFVLAMMAKPNSFALLSLFATCMITNLASFSWADPEVITTEGHLVLKVNGTNDILISRDDGRDEASMWEIRDMAMQTKMSLQTGE